MNEFKPRVPKVRIEGEDKKIARSCFSSRIGDCISSMPNGIRIARNLIHLEEEIGIPALMYLHIVDEKTIPPRNLVKPNYLAKNGLVVDAKINREFWVVNQSVQCKRTMIRLKELDAKMVPCKSTENRIFWKVSKLDYEKSCEDHDRVIILPLFTRNSYNAALQIAKEIGCKILSSKRNIDGSVMKLCVPAGVDICPLWERSFESYWWSFRNFYKKSFGHSLKHSRNLVIGGFDYESILNKKKGE